MSEAYSQRFSLENGSVLLTGATSGIGAVTAKTLAQAGAFVYLHYHSNQQEADAILEEINDTGGDGHCMQADLTDPKSIEQLFSSIERAGKPTPNMLVNMAARQDLQNLDSMTLTQWRDVMRVNQDAVFLLSQRFCNLPTAQKVIVNVASIEGLNPAPAHSHYATSKAALLMFTRALALEMSGKNIRVNAVSPGLIDRPSLKEDWPEGYQRWQSRCPLGSVGQAEDIANAICFLLSPAAKWINGANLVVDGGMSVQGWN